MTVTWLPSALVTCASYAAAESLLSFSVVAASTVPPTFASAAALTFASVSPVSGVSGMCVFGVVVVVVVVVPALLDEPAPIATVAPARASAPAADAPTADFLNMSFIGVLSRVDVVLSQGHQPHLGADGGNAGNVLSIRSAAERRISSRAECVSYLQNGVSLLRSGALARCGTRCCAPGLCRVSVSRARTRRQRAELSVRRVIDRPNPLPCRESGRR